MGESIGSAAIADAFDVDCRQAPAAYADLQVINGVGVALRDACGRAARRNHRSARPGGG